MNLKSMREKAGITQEQLATQLIIDRSTVSKWETNASVPRSDMLPQIARLLNCNIDDLFADTCGQSEERSDGDEETSEG